MFEGVGLRQLLDYYFILMNTKCSNPAKELQLLSKLNMRKFTSAVMWVLSILFHLPENKLICKPDEKEGQYLLDEVITVGNFGRGDIRYQNDCTQIKMLKKWSHLVLHYPSEVIWNPIWILIRKLKKY